MFCLSDTNNFYLYPYPTDMRKSFYSLSGIVTNQMGMHVQDGDAFVFINRSLTSMKILHAEFGGLVIYNMKLERGTIQIPSIDSETDVQSHGINWSELMMMVQGISMKDCKTATRWEPQK